MKNQNNNLQPSKFINKLKEWVYNLFHKASKKTSAQKDESEIIDVKKFENKNDNVFEKYKESCERRKYLLDLQRKYKAKVIREDDMKEEDRIDLENLYIEQNNELKRKIRTYDTQIAKMNKG